MYKKAKLIDTVMLPPERLGEETIAVVKDLLRDKLEGRIDKTLGSIIAVTDVLDIGEGRILTEKLRVELQKPFGDLCSKANCAEKLRVDSKIVTVGDITTYNVVLAV